MLNRFPLVNFIVALADYLFKAAVNYRETDEGRAEWDDVEAAYSASVGDEEGAVVQRAEAQAARSNLRSKRSGNNIRQSSVTSDEIRRPLSED